MASPNTTHATHAGSAPHKDQQISELLAQNWWAFAIRGVLGVGFGLIALSLPGVTILSLVIVFAAYAFIDGVFAIVAGARAVRQHERWGALVLEGIADIIAAAVAFLWPGITVVAFVFLVGTWAIISGGLMLSAAWRLNADHGRWWLVLGGVASALYGLLLIVAPLLGALVLTWWIAAYAIVFGIALIAAAFKLRARRHDSASAQAPQHAA